MMMDGGGAFGGAKAGGAFDPVTFAKKPPVILRALCLCLAVYPLRVGDLIRQLGQKGDDPSACNYGVGIGVIAFLASIGFLAGEYLFEQMSSVKSRKHYVLGDLAFSGLWAFLYAVGFLYLSKSWSNSPEPPNGEGVGNIKAAIAFCFFSVFAWGGCAFMAYSRFRAGAESAFAPQYDVDSGAMPGATAYSSFPGGQDMGSAGYSDPPFNQGRGGGMEYATPTY